MIEETFDLKSVINLVKRQRNLIFSVVVFTFSLAALFLFAQPAKYTASALIQVSPAQKNTLSEEASPQNFSINNVRVAGELEIMRSDAVALRVVQAANLAQDSEFGADEQGQNGQTRTLRNFQRASNVSRMGQTYLLVAELTANTADRAANLVNIWVQSYIEHQIAVKITALQHVEALMTKRLVAAQNVLVQSEARIDGFIFENIDLISAFNGQTNIANLARQYRELRAELPENTALQPNPIPDIPANAQVLNQQINAITQPSITIQPITPQPASQLRQLIRAEVLKSDLPIEIVAGIYALQQEANIARIEYDTILERRRALALQADLQIADSRLISPALPPLTRSNKSTKNIMLAALAIALALGLGLAIIKEYWIGGFTSEDQLRQNLSVRVGARIPEIRSKNTDLATANDFLDMPNSVYAESIRRLRVAIDQSLARISSKSGGKTVMITSSLPGEGKSNISLSLARAYALSGNKTLLIDCDFRRPKLHKLLAADCKNSLFVSTPDADDIPVFQDKTGLFAIIGSADNPRLNDQVFNSQKFKRFLDSSIKTYDIIILDTPPLLPIIDSAHLAAISDVIALTVKWASTQQSDVRRALKIISDSKSDNSEIVAILSQEKSKTSAEYGDAYYKS